MSGSISIFLKVCPACAAQVPTASVQCNCGQVFESTATGNLSPQELALRDEELYENYLLARAEQAQQAARSTQRAHLDDPENGDKAAEAQLAAEVTKSIESDLAEQRTKVEALRCAVEAQRPKPVIPAPAPSVATPPPASLPAVAESIPTDAAPDTTASRPSAPQQVEVHRVEPPATGSAKLPATASPILASPAASKAKAAHVLNAIKQAKAREAAADERKAQQARSETTLPRQPAPAAEPSIEVSAVPPHDFRKEQAARAEMVMETRKTADTKDCPNCTAAVPTNTSRCSCGFAFIAGGSDLPSLTLCTGDFTALRNSLNLNLRRS